jgi:hypothetical protein
MPTLRSTLDDLATNLASDILNIIRGSSLDELLGKRGGLPGRGPGRPAKSTANGTTKSGRLARRSVEEIAAALDEIVGLVRKHKDGLRAEEIRTALKLDRREVPRVLKEGLLTKRLKAKGQKRATTYTAM